MRVSLLCLASLALAPFMPVQAQENQPAVDRGAWVRISTADTVHVGSFGTITPDSISMYPEGESSVVRGPLERNPELVKRR